MLGRLACTTRLRPHTFPPPVRLAVNKAVPNVRRYARERRIPRDYRLPNTVAVPDWQRHSQAAPDPQRIPEDLVAQTENPKSQEHQAVGEGGTRENRLGETAGSHISGRRQSLQGDASPADQPLGGIHPNTFDETAAAQRPNYAEAQDTFESRESQPSSTEPQNPLPDLTQGIPSTLAAELNQARRQREASSASLNITEDPAEPVVSGGGRGGDGLPKSSYISSSDQKKNTAFKFAYLGIAAGLVGYTAYLGRNWETEQEAERYPNAPSGWGMGLFYNRVKARLGSTMNYYADPMTTTLLPDEDKDPNLRFPFVLVVSLEDMLVHSEWTRDKGWRIAKRPGMDYFLRYLSQYYEIVLFTSQPYAMAEQVVRKLDPFHMIQWPLFREATLYKDGGYIKDLSYLNRPLNKVLMLDTDPYHAKHQPENAIILPKWTGDPNDDTLVQFIPFLEYLATMGFDDARTVLKSFEGTFIPAEFARREKLLRQKFESQEAEKRGNRPKKVGGFSSMFGSRPSSPDGLEDFAEGKMYWDQIRARGKKQYEILDKRIKDEGEKWLADRAAEQKELDEEAMKNMRTGFTGWFNLGGSGGQEKK